MAIAIMHNRFTVGKTPATVTLIAGTGGSVSGGGNVYVGDTIMITATPNSGYSFIGWSANGVQLSSETEYEYKVTGNVTITGNFSQSQKVPGNITISPSTKTVGAGTPTFTSTTSNAFSFVEGGGVSAKTVKFTVSVGTAGVPDSYTYQWYIDGAKLTGETNDTYTTDALYKPGTYKVHCTVSNGVGSPVKSSVATLTVSDLNWKIKVTKDTTLKFTHPDSGKIDAFLVGGGGSGVKAASNIGGNTYHGGGGGCGGYTTTSKAISFSSGTSYSIVVGNGGTPSSDGYTGGNGGKTTAFGKTANGGSCGATSYSDTGKGGSGGGGHGDNTNPYNGGAGGSNGGNGKNGSYTANQTYGLGQGTTTREFGETTGTLYAGGGGGGAGYIKSDRMGDGGAGGSGGGGNGAGWGAATNGTANTGGGGGGGCKLGNATPGSGGSGVVIIRNNRG